MYRTTLILAIATLLVVPGCKKSAKKVGEKAVETAAAVKEKVAPKATTPDAVVNEALSAVKDRKPAALYAMLPKSYQKDVQDIFTIITSNMDKEIFELGVQVIDTAVSAVDKHSDKLKAEMKGAPFKADEVFSSLKKIHKTLKDTKMLNYDDFKKFDLAKFLGQYGDVLMKDGMASVKMMQQAKGLKDFEETLANTKVKLVETKDNEATIEITADGKTKKAKMTKVDGRWVPTPMAKDWQKDMGRSKKQLTMAMEQFKKNKPQIKKMLEMVLSTVKEFEKTGDLNKAKAAAKQFGPMRM